MKRFLVALFLALGITQIANSQTLFNPPREYNETVSATQANSEVAFGFAATNVVVVNNSGSADEAYVTFESGTATTDSFPLEPGEYLTVTFPGGKSKPRTMGIICDTGETATVRVIAWADY